MFLVRNLVSSDMLAFSDDRNFKLSLPFFPITVEIMNKLFLAAETWFSLVFTVLVEIVPASIRSVCIGTFLFLMNNVGGNVPLLIDPLAKLQGLGLQTALYIFWPGLIASSESSNYYDTRNIFNLYLIIFPGGVLFFVSSIPLWIKHREHNQAKKIPL